MNCSVNWGSRQERKHRNMLYESQNQWFCLFREIIMLGEVLNVRVFSGTSFLCESLDICGEYIHGFASAVYQQ